MAPILPEPGIIGRILLPTRADSLRTDETLLTLTHWAQFFLFFRLLRKELFLTCLEERNMVDMRHDLRCVVYKNYGQFFCMIFLGRSGWEIRDIEVQTIRCSQPEDCSGMKLCVGIGGFLIVVDRKSIERRSELGDLLMDDRLIYDG